MNPPDATARAPQVIFDTDRLTFWLTATLVLGSLCLFVGYPLLIVLAKSFGAGDAGVSLANYTQAFAGPRFLTAFTHSMAVSLTVTVFAVSLGFLFAYTVARFNGPLGAAADAGGNLLVADANSHTIRKLTLTGTNWAVTTLAQRLKATRDAAFITQSPEGVPVNRTETLASIGGAALNNEECYLISKLTRALGIVYLEHQARL